MRSRFVRPETTRLTLSDGDTLTVKRRLNTGEQRAAFASMAITLANGDVRANPFEVGIGMVLAYLVDWSLTDDDGSLLEIRGKPPEQIRTILDNLEPDDFEEIKQAIDAHVLAQTAQREAEKNGRDGGSGSPATSPSLVAVAGGTSGSRN